MRKIFYALVGMLFVLFAASASMPTIAKTTTLTFDEFGNQSDITSQYQGLGITVTGVRTLDSSQTGQPAQSGSYVAYSPDTFMTFVLDPTITGAVRTVSAYVSGTSPIAINLYDASGNLVGQSTILEESKSNVLLVANSLGNPVVMVTIVGMPTQYTVDTLVFADSSAAALPGYDPSLTITSRGKKNDQSFVFSSRILLLTGARPFDPTLDAVTLQIGSYTFSIPSGSFKTTNKGFYLYRDHGRNSDVVATITSTGEPGVYLVWIYAKQTTLVGISNPVQVQLNIGNNVGNRTVAPIYVEPHTLPNAPPKAIGGLMQNPFGR